jgi:hypothetical protein
MVNPLYQTYVFTERREVSLLIDLRFGNSSLTEWFLPYSCLLQADPQLYLEPSCGATIFHPTVPRGFPHRPLYPPQLLSTLLNSAMSNNHDIEPLSAPVRPGNERSLSQLEKATVSHVEHRGKGADALNDSALMAGERTEKVIWSASRLWYCR